MWPMSRADLHRLAPALLGMAAALGGCRQDMHDQRKLEPLEASPFFADGRGSRDLLDGTVARGLLKDDHPLHQGRYGESDGGPAGELVAEFPYEMTKDRILRGRERFDIYCSPCHARTGDGDGMIVRRGFKQPLSLTRPDLRARPVGYFFDVVTKGFGVMPSYAAQIPVDDRWSIVAYLRALQLSRAAKPEDVPAPVLRELEGGPGGGR